MEIMTDQERLQQLEKEISELLSKGLLYPKAKEIFKEYLELKEKMERANDE